MECWWGIFFIASSNNELLASDDETKRVMVIAYAAALPGLLVRAVLFPAYHGFPPHPLHPSFWAQASDHYFYVMYSFIVMGAATVYEWDLLFPDLLDIFVLSVLPIEKKRLFFARVVALESFLGWCWLARARWERFFFRWLRSSTIFRDICWRMP